MKKFITQEHASGCAVACTAFVAGITYKKALSSFYDGEFRAELRGFYCREIVRVLKKLGMQYDYFYLSKRNKKLMYIDKAIVFLKKSRKYPQGHYLCRAGKVWMDPWINYPSITNARSGFRKRLPGKLSYVVLPINTNNA